MTTKYEFRNLISYVIYVTAQHAMLTLESLLFLFLFFADAIFDSNAKKKKSFKFRVFCRCHFLRCRKCDCRSLIIFLFAEMARGSIGRERMLSGVVGMTAHQPPATGHQEDLNNELLAVSFLHGN